MPSLTGRVVLHNDLLAAAERERRSEVRRLRRARPVTFDMGIEEILLVCREL
jgi:hypothetical protein